MTTKKFAKQIDKYDKEINNFGVYLSAEDYLLKQNNKEVGCLKDEKCYLIATASLVKMFPSEALVNPVDSPIYKFIEMKDLENKEQFVKAVGAVYQDLYHKEDFVTDISALFESYQKYPEDIARIYENHIVFLRFAYEQKLLRLNPLDLHGRIIKFKFIYNDLTELGERIFPELYHKFLTYGDRTPNPDYEKMLPRWFKKLLEG